MSTLLKFRLRNTLVVPFVLQIVTAVGLVGYLSFRNGQQAVSDIAKQLGQEITNRISERLRTYNAVPPLVNRMTADATAAGYLNPHDQKSLGRHIWQQVTTFEGISFRYFGSNEGEMVTARRLPSGTVLTGRSNASTNWHLTYFNPNQNGDPSDLVESVPRPFNPRQRPWYLSAVATQKPVWTPIYRHFVAKELSITAVQPIYDRSGTLQGVLGIDFVFSQVNRYLQALKIGQTGLTFVIERSGDLVVSSTQEPTFTIGNEKASRIAAIDSKNQLINTAARHLNQRFPNFKNLHNNWQSEFIDATGKRYFLQVTPLQDSMGLDWLIVVVIPESDFMSQINANTRTTILLCLATLILAIVIGILTARWITRPILRITKASEEIAAGNLDKRVDTTDFIEIEEIDTLEHSFNSMAGQLKESFETLEDKVKDRTAELASANDEIIALNNRLQEDNLRMGAELDIVRQMQQMILPNAEELEIDGLDIAGYMDAADEVGGDYYDVLNTDGVVTLGIGDVTGHGLESGILMLMTQTAVRTLKEIREVDPVRFLDALNRTLYKNVQRMNSEKSLTLAILNYSQGRISISGQHEETLIVRKGGEIERIDTMDLGLPIALDDDIAEFISHISIELEPGDGVVLYTDGIPEAYDIHKKQYGLEPMCEVISQNWHLSAEEIKQAVIDDVRRHIGTQKVFDDITLLVLKRTEVSVEKELQPKAAALV